MENGAGLSETGDFCGEDLYVFEAEDAGEILNWHGEDNSSAGEYITGLIRNRMSGGNITAVTLRELFYEKYKEDKILRLPIVKIRMEVWKWKYKSGKYWHNPNIKVMPGNSI